MHVVKYICIFYSPMAKLYVQINANISMKYTTSCKKKISQLFKMVHCPQLISHNDKLRRKLKCV